MSVTQLTNKQFSLPVQLLDISKGPHLQPLRLTIHPQAWTQCKNQNFQSANYQRCLGFGTGFAKVSLWVPLILKQSESFVSSFLSPVLYFLQTMLQPITERKDHNWGHCICSLIPMPPTDTELRTWLDFLYRHLDMHETHEVFFYMDIWPKKFFKNSC
jgi:hypothetical protein